MIENAAIDDVVSGRHMMITLICCDLIISGIYNITQNDYQNRMDVVVYWQPQPLIDKAGHVDLQIVIYWHIQCSFLAWVQELAATNKQDSQSPTLQVVFPKIPVKSKRILGKKHTLLYLYHHHIIIYTLCNTEVADVYGLRSHSVMNKHMWHTDLKLRDDNMSRNIALLLTCKFNIWLFVQFLEWIQTFAYNYETMGCLFGLWSHHTLRKPTPQWYALVVRWERCHHHPNMGCPVCRTISWVLSTTGNVF